MKHLNLVIITVTLLFAALLVSGCSKSSPDSSVATAQQLDKIKRDTKQAAQDLKDYTYTQKTEFVAKMQAELAKINQELDELGAKIARGSESAKAEAQPKLDALRAQAAKLGEQLDKAKDATASTWEEVKAGSQKALDETKEAFRQAGQWIDDKFHS